jgi:hypothetical protein
MCNMLLACTSRGCGATTSCCAAWAGCATSTAIGARAFFFLFSLHASASLASQTRRRRCPALSHTLTRCPGRYEGGIREAKRHGTGVMLYADGSVFGGKWRDDLKYDGVFIDGNNNWTCGEWDGFVALQALAKIKMSRAKCLYTGNIRQGQR